MRLSIPAVSELRKAFPGLPVLSWAFYDFANTLYAINVFTLYFALWVTQDQGAPQSTIGLTLFGSMTAVALASPMFGAVSDRFGRRIPFLIICVVICVIATSVIGIFGGLITALTCFAIANVGYQTGNVFYDSMLPQVSNINNRGSISGLGVGLGYVGTIVGVLIVAPIVGQWGRGAAFIPSALLFLLFALPCFFLVKEGPSTVPLSWRLVHQSYAQLFQTIRDARRHANLIRFIAARFLYVDAVNTLLIFMAVYVSQVLGFSDRQVQILLITSTTFAIVGSFVYGKLVDRLGPKNTLIIILLQWTIVFVVASTTFYPPVFWAVGALAGIALGGLWSADRTLLIRLAPEGQTGEFFGLYQLAGRFAAAVGPPLWGFTTDVLSDYEPWNFRIGLLVLLVNLVLGLIILLKVRDRPDPSTSIFNIEDQK